MRTDIGADGIFAENKTKRSGIPTNCIGTVSKGVGKGSRIDGIQVTQSAVELYGMQNLAGVKVNGLKFLVPTYNGGTIPEYGRRSECYF